MLNSGRILAKSNEIPVQWFKKSEWVPDHENMKEKKKRLGSVKGNPGMEC